MDQGADLATEATPPAPTSEALVRLIVGAALLGLDGMAARSAAWEATAGIQRRRLATAPAEGTIGSGSFRHALIGWIFESEARLRPQGNPISWLRAVVLYLFSTIFAVLIELLPLPRPSFRRQKVADPSEADTKRWIKIGLAEEGRSRIFAQAALEDAADGAIRYLARRPAVAQALGEIVRSPAMDDAVEQIVAGPAVDQAVQRVAQSPALDTAIAQIVQSPALDAAITQIVQSPAIEQAVSHIVRTPAMEDAVTHLVGTKAMNDAIDTLAQSPALVTLVTTQGSSVANEILGQVRQRAVQSDAKAEALIRRILRRRPRTALPPERQGLMIDEP
jgi:hypothetical protein